jgi:hypothetical protein
MMSIPNRVEPVRRQRSLVDHSPVDATRYEDVQGQLFGLLVRLGDRIGDRDKQLLHEFIDAGEFGPALEQMADLLAEAKARLTENERDDLLTLVQVMKMIDRVPRAILPTHSIAEAIIASIRSAACECVLNGGLHLGKVS